MKKSILILCALGLFLMSPLSLAAEPDGDALYRKNCASCHGEDGKDVPIDSVAINNQSAKELRTKLAGYQDGTYGGKNKKMMQMALKNLSPEEIEAIVTYIQTFD